MVAANVSRILEASGSRHGMTRSAGASWAVSSTPETRVTVDIESSSVVAGMRELFDEDVEQR